jgi:hypothetical protein
VKWLKPAALRANWRAAEVERLAAALKAALRAGTPEARATFAAFAVGAKRQGRKALPGLGKYGAAHLYRTACVAMGVAFPGAAFVEMGEGASVAKYAQLRAWGIDDADALNAALLNAGYADGYDAGEVAYGLCMGGLLQGDGGDSPLDEYDSGSGRAGSGSRRRWYMQPGALRLTAKVRSVARRGSGIRELGFRTRHGAQALFDVEGHDGVHVDGEGHALAEVISAEVGHKDSEEARPDLHGDHVGVQVGADGSVALAEASRRDPQRRDLRHGLAVFIEGLAVRVEVLPRHVPADGKSEHMGLLVEPTGGGVKQRAHFSETGALAGGRRLQHGDEAPHIAHRDLGAEGVLVGKVEVKRALGDLGSPSDGVHGHLPVARLHDELLGGGDDGFSPRQSLALTA